MDITNEFKLLSIYIENNGHKFNDADEIRKFENKYLNAISEGTISHEFPKDLYVSLNIRANDDNVKFSDDLGFWDSDGLVYIGIAAGLYATIDENIIIGAMVFAIFIAYAFFKQWKNRRKILKVQISAFNDNYIEAAKTQSENRKQSHDDDFSQNENGRQDDYQYNQERWNNGQGKSRATQKPSNSPDSARFLDSRFSTAKDKKRYQSQYWKAHNASTPENEALQSLKWVRQADAGKQRGIKSLTDNS